MGDIADQIFDEGLRRENDIAAVESHMRRTCERETPKPCHLMRNDKPDGECPFMCAVCEEEFDF